MTTISHTPLTFAAWVGALSARGYSVLAASHAVTMLLMPSVNNRPSAKVGVDFGPGP